MRLETINWHNRGIRIINQQKLPDSLEYLYIRDIASLWQAIKGLRVRGAPALGAAAGLGVYLGLKDSRAKTFLRFKRELERVVEYLGLSRPTAVNLFWGLERIRNAALGNKDKPIARLKKIIFDEAMKIIEEDRRACRAIGERGAKLLKSGESILTACNAGILATIDYGTALGVVYRAKERGKRIKVFACETRPLLQGARLTAWELNKQGIEVTVICDSTAATLMRQGKVDKVIVGADRIASNGDTANKIGTYNLAVIARYHRIPFYVAAPASTLDLKLKGGQGIPIEERDKREVIELLPGLTVAQPDIKVYNPAFDVTPHWLITAIITDRGIVRAPFDNNIKKIISK